MKQELKNIMTGEEIKQEEFNFDWQEFVIKRQVEIDLKTDDILQEEISCLLNQIGNDDLKNKIEDIYISRENKLAYAYYCRGFSDGIKQMVVLNEA